MIHIYSRPHLSKNLAATSELEKESRGGSRISGGGSWGWGPGANFLYIIYLHLCCVL